jgi:hypothetical protein
MNAVRLITGSRIGPRLAVSKPVFVKIPGSAGLIEGAEIPIGFRFQPNGPNDISGAVEDHDLYAIVLGPCSIMHAAIGEFGALGARAPLNMTGQWDRLGLLVHSIIRLGHPLGRNRFSE